MACGDAVQTWRKAGGICPAEVGADAGAGARGDLKRWAGAPPRAAGERIEIGPSLPGALGRHTDGSSHWPESTVDSRPLIDVFLLQLSHPPPEGARPFPHGMIESGAFR